jgi:hypothetical protein
MAMSLNQRRRNAACGAQIAGTSTARSVVMAAAAVMLVMALTGADRLAAADRGPAAQPAIDSIAAFAGDNDGNIYRLDPQTGVVIEPIGNSGLGPVTGLAVHPATGVLYGVLGNDNSQNRGALIVVDQATGAGTIIGGANTTIVTDIQFAVDGSLYGVTTCCGLVEIDLATGAREPIGGTFFRGGLAISPTGRLYYSDGFELLTVDRGTLMVQSRVRLNAPDSVNALAFGCDGTLFTSIRLRGLATVDPQTGVLTPILPAVPLDAIAWACPATVRLMASSVVTHDAGGNGNGLLEPGETAGLSVLLYNAGALAATGVSATLTSNTAEVSVGGGGVSAYPDLNPDRSEINVTPFEVTAASSFGSGTTVQLTLNLTTAEGTFVVPVSLRTRRLFAADNNGIVYSLDPETGEVLKIIGDSQTLGITGLAVHPQTRELYGVTSARASGPNSLVRIDKTSGLATYL